MPVRIRPRLEPSDGDLDPVTILAGFVDARQFDHLPNLADCSPSAQPSGKSPGLDVFREEPLPAESPLWAMENVIMTR